MTGKDLFLALSFIDDELISEAEEAKPLRRAAILPAIRWAGALAACVCVLVGWAIAANFANQADSGAAMTTGGAAPESEWSTATDTAEAAGEAGAETADAAEGGEAGASEGGVRIIDRYLGENEVVTCYAAPRNGTWTMEQPLRDMLDEFAGADVRFLVTFELFSDGEAIEHDASAYLEEVNRLAAAGYMLRRLPRDDGEMLVCGLFTAEELKHFDALEAYGYDFAFPANADGTPLDWDDPAAVPVE